jgi:PAS domain S-box-containing protein
VTAVIECIRNDTERILAEKLLKESEATLMSMMDSMPAGVWWFDEAGEVEYLNSRFSELFGYRIEEIPTVKDWFRYAYPDPEQREMRVRTRDALIAEARLSGTPVPPQETMVACRDGSTRHIIVNTQFSQGRTLEIFTDITEQEFIHNELLKVQKMESLGVLAGGIAHDFNNILTGIMGNVSFAQLFLDGEHQARPPLEAAEKASQRAAELAHQLLTFAKGGQPIKKVVSVLRLVGEAVSLSLRGTNVQGKIEIPEDLYDIEADEGQINQAFNNIVINASHAMAGGGTLTVSGENVLLECGNRLSLRPGSYVKLLFKDEGCGIHQADLKNIFDPYFTTKSGGNGLGLASTLSIIRRHGGHIQVQSHLGVGTTFTFYLPSTGETSLQCEQTAAVEPERHAGGAVLIMDDEEMLRMLSSQILEHLGYQVSTCANGEEAIALYVAAKEKGTPYFAVIMDLTIPAGMGGEGGCPAYPRLPSRCQADRFQRVLQRCGAVGLRQSRLLRRRRQAVQGVGTGRCHGSTAHPWGYR